HVVEALDRAHRRDLRHAKPRAEARQAHVAAVLLRPLVERLAHDAEVRLRRERAAVALGRRTVRNVVEQALGSRADHRDDVAAGLRHGQSMHDVLVDVARRREHIAQRRWVLAEALARLAPLAHPLADLAHPSLALAPDALMDRLIRGPRQLTE